MPRERSLGLIRSRSTIVGKGTIRITGYFLEDLQLTRREFVFPAQIQLYG
jgi:hypothetical protein